MTDWDSAAQLKLISTVFYSRPEFIAINVTKTADQWIHPLSVSPALWWHYNSSCSTDWASNWLEKLQLQRERRRRRITRRKWPTQPAAVILHHHHHPTTPLPHSETSHIQVGLTRSQVLFSLWWADKVTVKRYSTATQWTHGWLFVVSQSQPHLTVFTEQRLRAWRWLISVITELASPAWRQTVGEL